MRIFRIAVLLTACVLGAFQAEQNMCDPHLPQPRGDPNGYKPRGDRCEGLYIKEVGGTSSLTLVSMTSLFEDYDPASGKDLTVEWNAPSDREQVHLRGVALRKRLYYRMDAVHPANSPYIWKTGVLNGLHLKKSELGVVGWIPTQVGSATRDVYLPLRIKQSAQAAAAGKYDVTVLPGAELTEVYVSLTPIGSDGRPGTPLLNGKKLDYGYYPADRGITFPVSNLRAPGIYMLEVGATLRTGEPTTLRSWFYHSGK